MKVILLSLVVIYFLQHLFFISHPVHRTTMSERLTLYNYLNVVAFALSWVLNSDVVRGPEAEQQNMFWSGIGNLFNRYESIVNPTSQTYLIAHLILLLEGVFTCVQLLPKYRASIMVQDSVKYWFLLSALMQFLWSVDLGFDNMFGQILSVLFMGGMFFSVTRILLRQAANTDSTQTPEEYWLLRFPFSMHFAWAMAVFSMSLNGFFVQLEFGRTAQVVMGIITLLSFIAVAYKMIFRNGPKPNYVVPLVLAWFCVSSNATYCLHMADSYLDFQMISNCVRSTFNISTTSIYIYFIDWNLCL